MHWNNILYELTSCEWTYLSISYCRNQKFRWTFIMWVNIHSHGLSLFCLSPEQEGTLSMKPYFHRNATENMWPATWLFISWCWCHFEEKLLLHKIWWRQYKAWSDMNRTGAGKCRFLNQLQGYWCHIKPLLPLSHWGHGSPECWGKWLYDRSLSLAMLLDPSITQKHV